MRIEMGGLGNNEFQKTKPCLGVGYLHGSWEDNVGIFPFSWLPIRTSGYDLVAEGITHLRYII